MSLEVQKILHDDKSFFWELFKKKKLGFFFLPKNILRWSVIAVESSLSGMVSVRSAMSPGHQPIKILPNLEKRKLIED